MNIYLCVSDYVYLFPPLLICLPVCLLLPARQHTRCVYRYLVEYINVVSNSAEMALAITSQIPRMRNTTRHTHLHERAQCLIDQLDFAATRLLEEMTLELQNYERTVEKSSLTSILRGQVNTLELEKSQLQSSLGSLQVICTALHLIHIQTRNAHSFDI